MTPVVQMGRALSGLATLGFLVLSDRSPAQSAHNAELNLIVLLAMGIVSVTGGLIAWLVTRYRVEGGELRVDKGLIRRQSLRARLDRIQSVDVHRPFLARIFGLSELRVTTAGTEKTSIRLRYLNDEKARTLRAELLGLAAGLGPGVTSAPERLITVVQPGALIGASILRILSSRMIVILLLPLVGLVAAFVGQGHAGDIVAAIGIGFVLPVLLYLGHDLWRQVSSLWNFTVAESPDGLRLRSGLLSTRAQTVPPGRIQAVRIHQPLLWRPFGWASVHMNVAGYAGKRQAVNTVLLPVGSLSLSMRLAGGIVGGVDISSVPLFPPPDRSRWRAPLWWKFMGVGSDDHSFVTRHGFLSRTIELVPHERIQSVRMRSGPWQNMLGLATVYLDSTRGPVTVRAAFRDSKEARNIVDWQAERAQHARRQAPLDRWMHSPQEDKKS